METHALPLAGMLAGMLRHERDREASATRRTTATEKDSYRAYARERDIANGGRREGKRGKTRI